MTYRNRTSVQQHTKPICRIAILYATETFIGLCLPPIVPFARDSGQLLLPKHSLGTVQTFHMEHSRRLGLSGNDIDLMVFPSLELRPLPQFPAYNRKIHRATNGAVEFRHERSQPHRIPASIGHQRNTYSIFKGNRHVLKQPPEFLCNPFVIKIAQVNKIIHCHPIAA